MNFHSRELEISEIALEKREAQISGLNQMYDIDLNFLDESLSKLVLFEWYKRHLSKFKFPQDKTKISFKQTEYIAFLSHFKDTEHYLIDNICREFIVLLTGGSIDHKGFLQ